MSKNTQEILAFYRNTAFQQEARYAGEVIARAYDIHFLTGIDPSVVLKEARSEAQSSPFSLREILHTRYEREFMRAFFK